LFTGYLSLVSKVLERPLGWRLVRSPAQIPRAEDLPLVGISHRIHLKGDTGYRYFGCRLDIGQHKKNAPPITNQNIFMQNAVSAKSETTRAEPKKHNEAAVFCGYLQ